jgi:mannosyltransferase
MTFLTQHTVIKFLVEGLWRDEAFSWAMASRGWGLLPLTARDFNPPLYYLLLAGWMQLVGSSELALRSLSVVFFVGTLLVTWRFMVDLLDVPRRRAWLYLALIACNPMLLYYAVEARMYSLVALLAATSFYAWLAQRPVLYVISTAAGLYTHYFIVLVLVCQVLGTTLAGRFGDLRRRIAMLALPLLLLAPWVFATLWLKEDGGREFWVETPGWRSIFHLVTSVYTGHDESFSLIDRPERWLFALGLLPIVLWSLWTAAVRGVRRDVVLGTALWALLPPAIVLLTSFVKPVFVPRYLIFSSVGLLLLFVGGLERARPRVRAAFLVILFGLALQYQVLQAHRHTKGSFRETLTPLALEAGPDDLLLVTGELEFFPALYYFDPDRVFVFGRPYSTIKPYTGKVLIPPHQVILEAPRLRSRVYVLNGERELSSLALRAY